MLLAACEQGERLDWWRSGVFNALFAGGAFFLLCALVRRLRGPNRLVALPYLFKWNTMLLGSLLFWFRFTLCTTIILVPQALAIRGFEPDQIGPAIIWSAVPLIPLAFTAALLLLRKFDPRLLLAIGLACTAFAAWLNAQYSSTWAAENFYRTELLTGVGQAFAFIGLVGCIVLQAIFAGALAKPEWVLTLSAFFHTIRIFGGTAGAIYMGHFVARTRKAALEPPGTSRQRWRLDHRSEHSRHDRRSLRQIVRHGRRGSARHRSDCSPAASTGLQLEHSRRVPADRLELRMRIDLCRSVTPIALGLSAT